MKLRIGRSGTTGKAALGEPNYHACCGTISAETLGRREKEALEVDNGRGKTRGVRKGKVLLKEGERPIIMWVVLLAAPLQSRCHFGEHLSAANLRGNVWVEAALLKVQSM